MALRATTNDENTLELGASLVRRQVDEGRAILARFKPDYEYDPGRRWAQRTVALS